MGILKSSRRSLNMHRTDLRKKHLVFRRSQVPSRSISHTVIRRSYVLPSLLLICNDVSDRLLHEPRRYKSSTYLITYIYIHTSHYLLSSLEDPFPISAVSTIESYRVSLRQFTQRTIIAHQCRRHIRVWSM